MGPYLITRNITFLANLQFPQLRKVRNKQIKTRLRRLNISLWRRKKAVCPQVGLALRQNRESVSKQEANHESSIALESCIRLLTFFSTCTSLEEVCRRLVFDSRFKGSLVGAHLFRLEGNKELLLETGCGTELELGDSHLTLADGVIVPISPIRAQPELAKAGGFRALIVPVVRRSVPSAVLVLELSESAPDPIIDEGALRVLQVAGVFIYDSLPLRPPRQSGAVSLPVGWDLNERHHRILGLMKKGASNREIGLALSISESTVRQENIKIFRYLGVSTRQQASSVFVGDED